MTILLTGATGLVGSRLLPRLVASGHDCRALVRATVDVCDGAASVEGDLFQPDSLIRALKEVSTVIHLAAVFRTKDVDLIWRSNLEGTGNLISAVQAHAPRARVILASTSNVYGDDGIHPGREDDVVSPEHAYPASKVAAEDALRASGLDWAILRFPFVYGNGDGHLEAFPRHAVEGGWHPAQRMSTIHHQDIASAMKLAIEGAMDRRVVNICDDAPTSVLELSRLVGTPMEGSAEPLDNPWRLHVDGARARTLGFRPAIRSVLQAHEQGLL